MKRLKVCRIASVPFSHYSVRNHLQLLAKEVDLTLLCSKTDEFPLLKKIKNASLKSINIEREISIFKDLRSVVYLYFYFKKNKFDIVHSNTPKAGIVVAIAAFLAGIKVRMHTFTGQRWATLSGSMRLLLILIDKVIVTLNTDCLADSFSQKSFLIENGIGTIEKLTCIHFGSFSGVDLDRFDRAKVLNNKNFFLRAKHHQEESIVITFVGRLVKDKGVEELVSAFESLQKKSPSIFLVLVGPIEKTGNKIDTSILKKVHESPNILHTGFVEQPEDYLVETDIFCLPSYREGFPTVVLEAAALSIPSIVTNIVGARDTIEDEVTGLLIEPNSVEELRTALERLVRDEVLRKQLGDNAFNRVKGKFDSKVMIEEYMEFYKKKVINEKVV